MEQKDRPSPSLLNDFKLHSVHGQPARLASLVIPLPGRGRSLCAGRDRLALPPLPCRHHHWGPESAPPVHSTIYPGRRSCARSPAGGPCTITALSDSGSCVSSTFVAAT